METWAGGSKSGLYIVLGSNGLIGSKTKESIRPELGSTIDFEKTFRHAREETPKVSRRLIEDHHYARISIIICSGAKGFELTVAEKNEDLDLFQALCGELRISEAVRRVVLSSSLGCTLSAIDSNYKQLVLAKEECMRAMLGNRAIVGRISSVYGSTGEKFSGLAGVLLWNTVNSRVTNIYGCLSTRRNYLEAEGCGEALKELAGARMYDDSECLVRNICAQRSMSISEIVSCVYRVTKKKPMVQLQECNPLAREDHFADQYDSLNSILVNRPLEGWISRELRQLKRSQEFP